MLKANGPSIRRQQAIECRITLCSANQHQTDAVPLSRRGSASRNLLPTNLLAGELEKDAPARTDIKDDVVHGIQPLDAQQHFTSSWPTFLPKAVCYAKCSVFYSTFALVLVPGLVSLLRTHAQLMLSSILLSFAFSLILQLQVQSQFSASCVSVFVPRTYTILATRIS